MKVFFFFLIMTKQNKGTCRMTNAYFSLSFSPVLFCIHEHAQTYMLCTEVFIFVHCCIRVCVITILRHNVEQLQPSVIPPRSILMTIPFADCAFLCYKKDTKRIQKCTSKFAQRTTFTCWLLNYAENWWVIKWINDYLICIFAYM